jgi:hypothetical protein
VLTYALQGPAPIVVTASADGENHLVAVPAATSAGYAAGLYTWSAYVTKAPQRFTIGTGTLQVTKNLATLTGVNDLRTHCKRMLDSIEAVLEGRASDDVAEYTIHGRMLKRIPRTELLRMHAYYAAKVRAEQGLGMGTKIGVTFGTP